MRSLGPRVWLAAGVWVLLIVVLSVVLVLAAVSSTVIGGALGAYCGATIAVVYALYERGRKRSQAPDPMAERYGR